MESILTSIKKLLGIEEDYTHFDTDIIMYINAELFNLTQLGVGPAKGFTINDSAALWADFTPADSFLEAIKIYVYMKVKLIFDPPLNSAVIECMNKAIAEFEWRLSVAVDDSSLKKEAI